MSPLNGKTFVLELSRDIRFKAKQELINYLREQNAHVSYVLTASTDYVLVSNDTDTYKTRRAKQLGIPLVNVEYIYECQKAPVDIKRFIVISAEDKENFSKSGTIPVAGGGSSSVSTVKPVKIDLSKIKIWNSDDVELPKFDELTTHADIGKWAIFKETNENSDVYFALELQIIPEEFSNQTTNDFRSRFRYEKQTITNTKGKKSLIQYAFSNDINELHQLFASYYNRIASMPRITRIRDLLPDKLGSKLLLRSLFLHRIDTQVLDDNVCQLIESLWIESIGDLNKILAIQPESIALKNPEAALLEIKSDSKSASEAEKRFYSLIPHQQSFVVDLINNRRALIDKIDLCQMLRDMVTVNELTNWNIKASIEAKYRALKCHIETVAHDKQEYSTICNMISSSTNPNEKVIVHQVYSIAKQTDALNFRSTLFNQKQLFHGSKYNNFLGILSRGLLMPKVVVNDLGVTRTDIGCLGYGIYFSDSVSTSLKYTTPSTTRSGRRLLCISQVALGNTANFYSYTSSLTQPPDNFHSTHGVKRTNENNSKFIDDEYAIYNLDQQRLLYIVEVSWMPHDDTNQSFQLLPVTRDGLTNRSQPSTDALNIPSTIEDEVIQIAEQDYGLICPSSGQLVPLKAFHIRAQLVDVTAEVVLYQVYHNTSSIPIEAKYVFPLEENCSVCGFEAHINNKIIKGVVKEKEQAKREYREAIEKGHGAYLMHQEQPEVFSVSVGNLPANCEVIIKITYVAELPIENNDIIFRLPAKVASWQSKQALEMKDQTIVPSINIGEENSSMKSVEFSLKGSIRMPYEITKLFSPTHRLRRKITDCIAMIELIDNILIEKDFILSITLKTVNLPRMLNETYDLSDENSQACMLTFYPKFEMTNNLNDYLEIIFIIDVSNSMDGNHIQQAKQLAHLFLTNIKQEQTNIYFNIVTFGSDNDECFPISLPNTKENIEKAKHYVLHSLDHRGNTDLFSVLHQYSLFPSMSKLGRQFLILSDGHINDLQSIVTLLQNQSTMRYDRIFACSIGDTSNKHNLKQLSNQANGGGLTTIFDSNYRSRWKTKVIQILEHIQQPCVTNISIDWHGTIDNNQSEIYTNQAPKILRSLFNGMRLTVYRFINNCHKATLKALINNQEFITSVFSNKITETQGRILHCLTARSVIQDYENGLLDNDEIENELIKKKFKQDLIDLSIKYSVVSSFTSFVAIEERNGEELEPGVRLLDVMLENDIDLLPYIGWDGERSQIDLIKEKLIDAKRSFDSSSITNKIQLTNEYENLCQNISYRAGGDAKYDLMLTIIDSYRTILNQADKARQLTEEMVDDLSNEISNATAEERKILEKRLEEILIRFPIEEIENLDLDDQLTLSDRSQLSFRAAHDYAMTMDDCMEDDADYSDEDEKTSSVISEEPLYRKMLYTEPINPNWKPGKKMIQPAASKSREYFEYDLFDDDDDADEKKSTVQTVASKLPTCASAAKKDEKQEEKEISYESDDEGDDMGFGLFDDDYVPIPSPLKSVPIKTLESEKVNVFNKVLADKSEVIRRSSSPRRSSPPEKQLFDMLAHPPVSSANKKEAALPSDSFEDDFFAALPASIFSRKYIPLKAPSLKIRLGRREEEEQQQKMSSSPDGLISPSYSPASPKYSPTSLSYSDAIGGEKASSHSDVFNSAAQDPYLYSPINAPQLPSFGMPTPTINILSENSLFSSPQSMTSTTTAQSSPSQRSWSNLVPSFAPVEGSVVNKDMSTSPTSTGFGGAPTFSFAAPPPPPPPLPQPPRSSSAFSFGVSQILANNNVSSSTFTGFGMAPPPASTQQFSNSTLFGSGSSSPSNLFTTPTQSFGNPSSAYKPFQPLPPPPPLLVPSSASFGSSPGSSINPSATPFHPPIFGMPQTFVPPPPPPPSFSGAPLFGGSSSGGTNIFMVPTQPSASGTTQMSMSVLPPPLPPSQTSFSFGASPTHDPGHIASRLEKVEKELSTSTTSSSPSGSSSTPFSNIQQQQQQQQQRQSTFSVQDACLIQNTREQTEISTTSVVLDEPIEQHYYHVQSDRGDRSGARGGSSRGRGSPFLASKQTLQHESISTPQYSMRYCDTRADESVAPTSIKMETTQKFDDDSVTMSKIKKKKQPSVQNACSAHYPIQDLLLIDVTPLGLGIEDVNGHMYTIISRNRTIPTKSPSYPVFTNAYAYQITAKIRVFRGEHKLTKYNTFIGELCLTGLTSNFTSQVLEISILMDVDANGFLEVEAQESRSGAKAKIRIDPNDYPPDKNDIERHVAYVESDPSFRAPQVADRRSDEPLYMLTGETEHSKVNFTTDIKTSDNCLLFEKIKNFALTSTNINELKRIQFTDGSFDLNQDLANLLAINISNFDKLKKYLHEQGFNSLALNIQNEIIHLIATGIILIQLFFQVPIAERKTYLVPFDQEEIRSIFHRHLPKTLLDNIDKSIDYYEQKRLRYGIYCQQLELNYSSWEKFIQQSIFQIDN